MLRKSLLVVVLVLLAVSLLGCSKTDLTGNWKGTKSMGEADGKGLHPKLRVTSITLMISQKGQDVTGTYTETAEGFYTLNYPLTGLVTKDKLTFTADNWSFSGKFDKKEISGELKSLAKYSLKVRKQE